MSEAIENDRFARELAEAYETGMSEHYARVLSGRLRQMDKRARAANVRADNAEKAHRLAVAMCVLMRDEIKALSASSPEVTRQGEG